MNWKASFWAWIERTGKRLKAFIESLILLGNKVSAFGKFERFIAGVCLAIPFFLLIAELEGDQSKKVLYLFPIGMILSMQAIILFPAFKPNASKESKRNRGVYINVVGGLLITVFYFWFTNTFGLSSKKSISAYVTMDDSYVFGMLLSGAAVLFMASGVTYWKLDKENKLPDTWWRSLIYMIMGPLLLGVIIFPCDTQIRTHMFFAITFFGGCALSTLKRRAKKENEIKHRSVDYGTVLVMVIALAIAVPQHMEWWTPGEPWKQINLFVAESIALWITGMDFVLVSLQGAEKRQ